MYFLVLSNLIFLLSSILLLLRGKYMYDSYEVWDIEVWDCIFVGITSGFYHLCDTSHTICISNYEFLRHLDLLCSLFVLTSGFTLHFQKKLIKIVLHIICLILVLVFADDFYYSILPVLLLNITLWLYFNTKEFYIAFKKLQQPSGFLLCAIISVILAYIFKIKSANDSSTSFDYDVMHGLWHSLCGIAIIFSAYASIPPPVIILHLELPI